MYFRLICKLSVAIFVFIIPSASVGAASEEQCLAFIDRGDYQGDNRERYIYEVGQACDEAYSTGSDNPELYYTYGKFLEEKSGRLAQFADHYLRAWELRNDIKYLVPILRLENEERNYRLTIRHLFEFQDFLTELASRNLSETDAVLTATGIEYLANSVVACFDRRRVCHPELDRPTRLNQTIFRGVPAEVALVRFLSLSFELDSLPEEEINRFRVDATATMINMGGEARWIARANLEEMIASDTFIDQETAAVAFLNLGSIYLNALAGSELAEEGLRLTILARELGNPTIRKQAIDNIGWYELSSNPYNDTSIPCLAPPWTRTGFWMHAWSGCSF